LVDCQVLISVFGMDLVLTLSARREYIPVGSDPASMLDTAVKAST
jgi:hypothetical protein